MDDAVARDRTRVTRVTGGNTHHYTTTTVLLTVFSLINFLGYNSTPLPTQAVPIGILTS
jgi:hypothetical protein